MLGFFFFFFFCKGLDNKYFGHCGLSSPLHYSALVLWWESSQGQYIKECMWLCSNKIFLAKTDLAPWSLFAGVNRYIAFNLIIDTFEFRTSILLLPVFSLCFCSSVSPFLTFSGYLNIFSITFKFAYCTFFFFFSHTSSGVGHRRGLDPMVLWLWCRLAAVALIQPLAPGNFHMCRCGPKKAKKKKKKKKSFLSICLWLGVFRPLTFNVIIVTVWLIPC